MKKLIPVALLGILLTSSYAYGNAKLDNQLQQVISQQRAKYQINAISLSIGLPTQKIIKNYTVGNVSQESVAEYYSAPIIESNQRYL